MQTIKTNANMYSLGILWNMGNEYAEEIIFKIATMQKMMQIKKYNLQDKYDEFVLDCYDGDNEAFLDGYIYDKIKSMKNSSTSNVIIFVVEINNPTFRLNIENGMRQCIEVRQIKQKIRDEYASKINGYFFDNLIHMTDNEEEYKKILSILYKYDDYIEMG